MRFLVFPAAFMANTFAMMLVMIGLSVFGKPELAADFGLVHGATVALFYSFSGNARSLILGLSKQIGAAQIFSMRLLLLAPLSLLAFMLSVGVVEFSWLFTLLLVGRRAAEWLSEVVLSEQELLHRSSSALSFSLTQGLLSAILLMALVNNFFLSVPVLLLWAISPLFCCLSSGVLTERIRPNAGFWRSFCLLLPHFGSTAVIGVCVYFFRLFILLIAGKQVAGDLFSAFALGGILGAVFAQALGPTLVRHEHTSQGGGVIRLLSFVIFSSLGLGVGLAAVAIFSPELLEWSRKSSLFWLAVGCSLVGGVVMVQAQRIRLGILQSSAGGDVFGSDMLSNIVLVVCIPVLYYLVGVNSLAVLYLFGAVISLVFYGSEKRNLLGEEGGMFSLKERFLLPFLAFALFVPIFFQLANGVFREQASDFSSGGSLMLLPIPLSVLACFAGIILLGSYAKVRLALVSVFLLFVGMLLSTVLLQSGGEGYERSKLMLLVQYLLPMFALVLGQQYGLRRDALGSLARVLFWLLMAVIPLQLVSTLASGMSFLSPSLYVFSVYQHLQYAPVLFVGGFLIAIFTLWENGRFRVWLFLLSTILGFYTSLSVSMLAIGFLFLGMLFFAGRRLMLYKDRWLGTTVFLCALFGLALGFMYISGSELFQLKFGSLGGAGVAVELASNGGPKNVEERFVYWGFYISGITEGWRELLFGHVEVPDRSKFPSAHNYYLDFVYNFGLLAILPMLCLIVYTLYMVLRNFLVVWRSSSMLGVAGVVVFLVLADNCLKVGMRQPYPGIITFFLWGVLLALLLDFGGKEKLAVKEWAAAV